MDYRITHRTVYDYSEAVSVSHHAARLLPMQSPTQQVSRSSLTVSPPPAVRKESRDYFGNAVCSFAIQEIHRHFEVVARSQVTVNAGTAPALALSPTWEEVAACFRDPVSPADVPPYEFCMESPFVRLMPDYADYARQSFPPGTPLLTGARDIMRRIHADFRYDRVATTVATPIEEVWGHRHGVCQDFAHMAVPACARSDSPRVT